MIVAKYAMNLDDIDFRDNGKIYNMVKYLTNEGKKVLYYSIESYFANSIPTEEDIINYLLEYYKFIVEYLTSNRCFKGEFYKEKV